jgi:hypothetical protein
VQGLAGLGELFDTLVVFEGSTTVRVRRLSLSLGHGPVGGLFARPDAPGFRFSYRCQGGSANSGTRMRPIAILI